MTKKSRRVLRKVQQTIKKNRPRVAHALEKSGVKASRAVKFTAARYYTTLERLAKE